MFDTFDLVRIDPITATDDPLLTYDQITKVQLYELPAGSTDPAAGSWVDATNDPCPDACDGTFPGYTLTAAERAVTIGFRLNYIESPTRGRPAGRRHAAGRLRRRRLDRQQPAHPPGVPAARRAAQRPEHVPVTADRSTTPPTPGVIDNTVRAGPVLERRGHRPDPDHAPTPTPSWSRTSTSPPTGPRPGTAARWASRTRGAAGPVPDRPGDASRPATPRRPRSTSCPSPIRTPATGTGRAPLARSTRSTWPASSPSPPPGDIGASDVTVTLDRGAGGTTDYTRDEALALTEAAPGRRHRRSRVTYTGRINAATDTSTPTATRDLRHPAAHTEPRRPDATAGRHLGLQPGPGRGGRHGRLPRLHRPQDRFRQRRPSSWWPQGIDVVAGKSFDPTSITEPSHGPVTVTLSGQPTAPTRGGAMPPSRAVQDGPDRHVADVLERLRPGLAEPDDASSTRSTRCRSTPTPAAPGRSTAAASRCSPAAPGSSAPRPRDPTVTLPGRRHRRPGAGAAVHLHRTDGANWENPADPMQTASFQVTRRDTLHTGGPVLPDLAGNPPAPGETAPGSTTDTMTADVTSSDVDANGDPLTATDDAAATIIYHHANNAVQVTQDARRRHRVARTPFPYTMTVTNTGDVDITNPVITDLLPDRRRGPAGRARRRPGVHASPSPAAPACRPTPTDVTIDADRPPASCSHSPTAARCRSARPTRSRSCVVTRPGLPAGTEFTNTFGVTGDRPVGPVQQRRQRRPRPGHRPVPDRRDQHGDLGRRDLGDQAGQGGGLRPARRRCSTRCS